MTNIFRIFSASACFALRFQNKFAIHLQRLTCRIQQQHILSVNFINNIRFYSSSSLQSNEEEEKTEPGEMVKFTFVTIEGEEVQVEGESGKSVMTIGVEQEVGMEGACGGKLACTTCHVYVEEDIFNKFEEPVEKEEDLLDCAPFLKPSSRLSCQLIIKKEIEGAKFILPAGTLNMQVDGYKPPKH